MSQTLMPSPGEAAAMLDEADALDAVLRHSQPAPEATAARVDGLLIGWITALPEPGRAMVLLPSQAEQPLPARSLCALDDSHIGAQCALMFEGGRSDRPIVMGLLQHPVLPVSVAGEAELRRQQDGCLLLSAREEIVLHCGQATLRLSQDGRIELRGSTVISHASGLNRVRGGSVKLN